MDTSAVDTSAVFALLGVIISQLFEWVKRRDDDREEAKKRFFDLKRESYLELIDVSGQYMYVGEDKEKLDTMLPKLQIAASKAELVGNDEVASLIRENWMIIADKPFLEDKLIPALKRDIQSIR